MKHLETFRTLTSISYLPKFSIIHFNKFVNTLYLPNQNMEMSLLGKWSSSWYSKESFLVGHLEQDSKKNVIFNICAYYRVNDSDYLESFSKQSFESDWNKHFIVDIFLTPIHFITCDKFINNTSNNKINTVLEKVKPISVVIPDVQVTMKEKVIDSPVFIPSIIMKDDFSTSSQNSLISIQTEDSESTEKVTKSFYKQSEPISTNYSTYLVCKTDKPEIYHVYNDKQYVSTCLIPNIKTSKFMNSTFEHLPIGKCVELKLKLHEKSNKYIPVI